MDKQTFTPSFQMFDLPVDVALSLHKRKMMELEVLKRLKPAVMLKVQAAQKRLNDARKASNHIVMEELSVRSKELSDLHWQLGRVIESEEVESESLRLLIEVTQEMEDGKETV